jgi:hypothetical protein
MTKKGLPGTGCCCPTVVTSVTQAGPDCLVAYLSGLGPSLERELYTCIGVVLVGRDEGIVRGV